MSSRLADERFLVTGSEGCIGSWVVATLVQAGAVAIGSDLRIGRVAVRALLEPELAERAAFVECDITEPGAVERLIGEHGVTRIVHVAALQVPFVAADPVRGADVNVTGTMRVLEAARRAGGQVRGIAYASSSAALGARDPHEPETLYGVLKRCNEASARIYARDYETPSVGLRPCVVYGPNRDQGLTSALTTAIKAAVLGERFEVPFGGSLDAQFAEDVAWAFILAAMAQPDGAPVFDLHGEVVSVERFLAVVAEAVPGSGDLLGAGEAPIPGKLEFSDAELRAFLGELPKTSLAEGVARTVAAYELALAEGRSLPMPA